MPGRRKDCAPEETGGGREEKGWRAMDEDRTDEIIRDILEHWEDEEGDGRE